MKRVISLVLSLTLIITLASITQAAPVNRPCKQNGSGTLESPYKLCYAKDFELMRSSPNAHFTLGQDIDFTGMPSWVPITQLNGSLNGKNFSINNLWSEENGLILRSYGVVKNLMLRNVNINGSYSVSALVGTNYGTISNVTVSGNINGLGGVGGMVAGNFGLIERSLTTGWVTGVEGGAGGFAAANYGEIINSRSLSNVYGESFVGGFVTSNSGEITDCEAWGHVVVKFTYGGTFVDTNSQFGTITRSKSFGNLYTQYAHNPTSANIGLFFGMNDRGKIVKSYATGKILSLNQQPQW